MFGLYLCAAIRIIHPGVSGFDRSSSKAVLSLLVEQRASRSAFFKMWRGHFVANLVFAQAVTRSLGLRPFKCFLLLTKHADMLSFATFEFSPLQDLPTNI